MRAELKKVEKNLRGEILRVEEKVERLEDRFGNLENRFGNLEDSYKRVEIKLDRIQNTMDKFVGRVDDLTTDNQVGALHTRELECRLMTMTCPPSLCSGNCRREKG